MPGWLDYISKADREITLQILASLVFSILFFIFWPTNVVWDDAGIILKYMDNFADGYFYTYNPGDGPIFGISGFIHGIVAGLFAFTHIFSPLNSLFASNFIGLFFTSFLSLRLLSRYSDKQILIYSAWFVLMLCSPSFVICIKQGLETPLHLSIILFCFFLLLYGKSKYFWSALLLAAISKLDAAPICVVLAVAFLIRNWLDPAPIPVRAIAKDLLFFGILPGLVWVIFTYIVFDGPVPHTAVAKYYYHKNLSDHWFPYLLSFALSNTMIYAALILFIFYTVLCLSRKEYRKATDIPVYGFAVIGYLILYYFYNPKERMVWYYAVPEFLILLQLLVILLTSLPTLLHKYSTAAGVLVMAAVLWICSPQVFAAVQRCLHYLHVVETERMAVGDWIHENSNPSDTLLCGFGHFARNSRLYTIDISGLNSRVVLDYGRKLVETVQNTKPTWIARHGLLESGLQIHDRYRLCKSFYNIAGMEKWPSWRVFKKTLGQPNILAVRIEANMVSVTGQGAKVEDLPELLIPSGETIVFHNLPPSTCLSDFITGIMKKESPLLVRATACDTSGHVINREIFLVDKRNEQSPVDGYTGEIWFRLNPDLEIGSIEITAQNRSISAPETITLVDPVLCTILQNRSGHGRRLGEESVFPALLCQAGTPGLLSCQAETPGLLVAARQRRLAYW